MFSMKHIVLSGVIAAPPVPYLDHNRMLCCELAVVIHGHTQRLYVVPPALPQLFTYAEPGDAVLISGTVPESAGTDSISELSDVRVFRTQAS